MLLQPVKIIETSSSSFKIFKVCATPKAPAVANPYIIGRPIITALAPKAIAFIISVPLFIPPSNKIGIFPSTAFAIFGKSSILDGIESSVLPP